jgi:hypothetical protein
MPFGLTNSLAIFMDYMNCMFRPYLDQFVVAFIDDILVYSKLEEEHAINLDIVLKLLQEKELYARLEKCDFLMMEVKFFGHVINQDGVSVDPSNVEVVMTSQPLKAIIEIKSFLGLAGYYRRFIEGFSIITKPFL